VLDLICGSFASAADIGIRVCCTNHQQQPGLTRPHIISDASVRCLFLSETSTSKRLAKQIETVICTSAHLDSIADDPHRNQTLDAHLFLSCFSERTHGSLRTVSIPVRMQRIHERFPVSNRVSSLQEVTASLPRKSSLLLTWVFPRKFLIKRVKLASLLQSTVSNDKATSNFTPQILGRSGEEQSQNGLCRLQSRSSKCTVFPIPLVARNRPRNARTFLY
jgi:hypothetical protein